jgi:hypothetical protein
MAVLDSLPDRPLEYEEAMALHDQNFRITPTSLYGAEDLVYTLVIFGNSTLHGIGYNEEEGGWVTIDRRPEDTDLQTLSDSEKDHELAALQERLMEWADSTYPDYEHERV